jgi:hypothetical protein
MPIYAAAANNPFSPPPFKRDGGDILFLSRKKLAVAFCWSLNGTDNSIDHADRWAMAPSRSPITDVVMTIVPNENHRSGSLICPKSSIKTKPSLSEYFAKSGKMDKMRAGWGCSFEWKLQIRDVLESVLQKLSNGASGGFLDGWPSRNHVPHLF